MRPLAVLTVTAGLCLLGSGCERPSVSPLSIEGAPAPEHAPDVSWQQNGQTVSLSSMEGRTVVLHFAEAASPSWDALEEAYPDLYAEGATVLGIVTDDAPTPDTPFEITASDELADAFGITITPTSIVVDAQGRVRGRDYALDADAFFALAAPVLLDDDTDTAITLPETSGRQLDAEALDRLVRAGAVLIDLRTDAARDIDGWVPLALPCPIETLTAEYLPADLSATVVFLGPDADAASELASEWGYVSILGLADAAPYVQEGMEPEDQPLAPISPSRTVRG